MKTVTFIAGDSITEAAQKLVTVCKTKDKAQGTFNDITLVADKTSTVEGIVAFYQTESKRLAEAWRNSPEGQKAMREREERKVELQKKHDTLMAQLPNLDFDSDVAILDWLYEFQPVSDHVDVTKQPRVVLETFAAHGYHPYNGDCVPFDENDRKKSALHLVRNALVYLATDAGTVHQCIRHFTREWRKQFLSIAA